MKRKLVGLLLLVTVVAAVNEQTRELIPETPREHSRTLKKDRFEGLTNTEFKDAHRVTRDVCSTTCSVASQQTQTQN